MVDKLASGSVTLKPSLSGQISKVQGGDVHETLLDLLFNGLKQFISSKHEALSSVDLVNNTNKSKLRIKIKSGWL